MSVLLLTVSVGHSMIKNNSYPNVIVKRSFEYRLLICYFRRYPLMTIFKTILVHFGLFALKTLVFQPFDLMKVIPETLRAH